MSCAAAIEVALRQRLEGVETVKISESAQTAEVTFAPGGHAFSREVFSLALRQSHVDIVTLEVEACGVIAGEKSERRLQAGKTEFVLTKAGEAAAGAAVCVAGLLEEQAHPMRLVVSRMHPAPGAGNGS